MGERVLKKAALLALFATWLHIHRAEATPNVVLWDTFAPLADTMVGPLIYSISDDAVAAAKVISDFSKTNDKLVVKGGNYAGKNLDVAGVTALASIPSREVLIAQLLGVMQAPVSGFARVLAAIAAQKGEGSAAPAAETAAAE